MFFFLKEGFIVKPHDRFMDDKEIIKACHRYIAVNHQVMSYGSPPTGLRLFKRAAFPRISDKDSCWKRRWTVVLSSSPVWRASALPSFTTSATAVLCQAPRLSTTMGTNSMPCLPMTCPVCACVLCLAHGQGWWQHHELLRLGGG